MNESAIQPATQARKTSNKNVARYIIDIALGIIDIALGISVFPVAAYVARKYGVWPDAVLGLLSLGVPRILIAFDSWNRWFHPERRPTRWPASPYPRGERLQKLDYLLNFIWVAGLFTSWLINVPKHHSALTKPYYIYIFVMFSAIGWEAFLTRYIKAREYIPPPDPPYDPSKRGKFHPLRSDHWGQRETS